MENFSKEVLWEIPQEYDFLRFPQFEEWRVVLNRTQEEENKGMFEPCVPFFYSVPDSAVEALAKKEEWEIKRAFKGVALVTVPGKSFGLSLSVGGTSKDLIRAFFFMGLIPPVFLCRIQEARIEDVFVLDAISRSLRCAINDLCEIEKVVVLEMPDDRGEKDGVED